MRRYRAWHMKNGKGVKKIEFQAKSLRAAKSRARVNLPLSMAFGFKARCLLMARRFQDTSSVSRELMA